MTSSNQRISWHSLSLVLGIPLLVVAFAVGWFAMWAYRDGIPVAPQSVKRKEHVIYQTVSELESGSYADVIDRLFFDRVEPEDNFLVTVLETEPEPGSREAHDQIGTSLNRNVLARYRESLMLSHIKHQNLPSLFAMADHYRHRSQPEEAPFPASSLAIACHIPYRFTQLKSEAGQEMLEAVYQDYGSVVDYVVEELERREHFAYPSLAGEEFASTSRFPILEKTQQLGHWIRIRAEWKVDRGDWEGAWQDCRAVLKLSNLLNEGPLLQDLFIVDSVRHSCVILLVDLLNGQGVSDELFEEIAGEIPQLWEPVTGVLQLDVGERAKGHFLMNELLLTGKWPETLAYHAPELEDPNLVQGWVKSSLAIDEFNRCVDEAVELLQHPPANLLQAVEELRLRRNARLKGGASSIPMPLTEETRKAVRILLNIDSDDDAISIMDSAGRVVTADYGRRRIVLLTLALHRYAREQQRFPNRLEEIPGLKAEWLICPQTGEPWEYTAIKDQATIWGRGNSNSDFRGGSEQGLFETNNYSVVNLDSTTDEK